MRNGTIDLPNRVAVTQAPPREMVLSHSFFRDERHYLNLKHASSFRGHGETRNNERQSVVIRLHSCAPLPSADNWLDKGQRSALGSPVTLARIKGAAMRNSSPPSPPLLYCALSVSRVFVLSWPRSVYTLSNPSRSLQLSEQYNTLLYIAFRLVLAAKHVPYENTT